ncbi:MAG: hypothetical protein GQ542_00190 [Desulforhopalus sp.]|nr:hypothetical protein [Desulforhopalus sp.]
MYTKCHFFFIYMASDMYKKVKNLKRLIQNGAVQSANYTCRGKTHCSQMTSCEEARFYLRNCPATKIDGDGNGVPCEKQWCGQ